jgi:hypothetical protein
VGADEGCRVFQGMDAETDRVAGFIDAHDRETLAVNSGRVAPKILRYGEDVLA